MFNSPHIRLLVSDFPACFRFYRDVMGMTTTFGTEDDVYADFSLGDASLALFQRLLMQTAIGAAQVETPADSVGKAAIVFATDNVDTAAEALRGKGVTLVTEPRDQPLWGIRIAHFYDPDGNLIEFNSPLSAHAGE